MQRAGCNKRNQSALAAALGAIMALSGCASYTPTVAPLPPGETMPISQRQGTVEVGADPYIQANRQKEYFGGDLNAAGVLAIQVFLKNRGEKRLLVRPTEISLELQDGKRLISSPAGAAAGRMAKYGGAFAATLLFGISGATSAGGSADDASTVRLWDYKEKGLKEIQIGKDRSAHGFVYFLLTPEIKEITSPTMVVRFVEVEEGTSFEVRLLLSSLSIKGGSN